MYKREVDEKSGVYLTKTKTLQRMKLIISSNCDCLMTSCYALFFSFVPEVSPLLKGREGETEREAQNRTVKEGRGIVV